MHHARVGYPIDGLCCRISYRQPLLDLPRPRQGGTAKVLLSILAVNLCRQQIRRFRLQEKAGGQLRQTVLSSENDEEKHGERQNEECSEYAHQ